MPRWGSLTAGSIRRRKTIVTLRPVLFVRTAAVIGVALVIGGCSSVESLVAGEKIDYRSAKPRSAGLEVPPDLTQIARDPRAGASASVSASSYQATAPVVPQAAAAIAEQAAQNAAAGLRIERSGNERWLVTRMTPEQLWPQLQSFWRSVGFNLTVEQASAGVMETDWAENRAKLPTDVIRQTLGKLIDAVYSTGERDKFRTRVERTATGSEVYISHRGMEEAYVGALRESTVWKPRPTDAELEAIFLQRLMVHLGAKQEVARESVARTTAAAAPARAQILTGQPAATLQVDDGFDRAWRRVGIALDRSGFTVEDRDRAQGLYYVRYVDPASAGKEEPGFLSRWLPFGRAVAANNAPVRYRVQVRSSGERSLVQVLNGQGAPENGEAGQRIVRILLEDLK